MPRKTAVEKAMAELRALPADSRPDLILVAAHAGLERDPKTGATLADELPARTRLRDRHERAGHRRDRVRPHPSGSRPSCASNGVLLMQPKNWGIPWRSSIFELDSKPGGGWSWSRKRAAA